VWKAGRVDTKRVEFVWASDLANSRDYWKRVIQIAKSTTVLRATRALTIMGRKEGEMKETSQYFYPMMQVADIFELGADITQLGLDQRRANILAREVGEKLGWWKPIVVSHHMLIGLQGVKQPEGEGFDENKKFDVEISSKMSKSKPETTILVHDTSEVIKKKIAGAFCPPKVVDNNPILDYSKHIIFKKFGKMKIEREKKFGGDVTYKTYEELEKDFVEGKLHPADLKNAAADALDKSVEPIRKHFEKKGHARELYEMVKKSEVTR
jgi:tyrosyl-tRNA synthetase